MIEKINLPYALDALEPYYDKESLDIHYNILYTDYVNNTNKILTDLENARNNNDYSNIKFLERELSFMGSGAILHQLFFENLSPNKGNISSNFMNQIIKDFGNFDNMISNFKEASKKVESNGWGIIAYSKILGKLVVLQCEKHQDLTLWGCVPILVVDMWEHSYFLKYKTNREDYLNNIFNVINFDVISKRFDSIYFQDKITN